MIFNGQNENSALVRIQYDLPWFIENVIGYSLDTFHVEQLNLLWNNRFVCIISPRGHLKTTLFSVCYSIWLLYTKKDIRIALVSAGLQQAKDTLEIIKKLISENEVLRELIPTDRSDSWSKTELTTRNGNVLKIKPFTTRIRGTHVDYFICDDILRDEEITQEQAKELFWSVITPCVNTRKGQLIVVGTPMKTDDLLAELEEKKGWIHKRYSAVIMDDTGNWIEPLWKKRFDLTELEQIRNNMGLLKFDREYLCNPMAGGDSFFPEEMIKGQIHSNLEINTPKPKCLYYMGIDVALKKGSSADFSVFTIIEKDEFQICRLVKLERYKGKRASWQLTRIKELHKIFNFRKIQIEERGLSQSLVSDAKLDDDLKFVTVGFKTVRASKERVLGQLQSGFMTKTLFILNHPILIKELMAFQVRERRIGTEKKETYEGVGAHDDTVISLALAYDIAYYGNVGVASFEAV